MEKGDMVEVKQSGVKAKVSYREFNRVWVLINGVEKKFMSWELEEI